VSVADRAALGLAAPEVVDISGQLAPGSILWPGTLGDVMPPVDFTRYPDYRATQAFPIFVPLCTSTEAFLTPDAALNDFTNWPQTFALDDQYYEGDPPFPSPSAMYRTIVVTITYDSSSILGGTFFPGVKGSVPVPGVQIYAAAYSKRTDNYYYNNAVANPGTAPWYYSPLASLTGSGPIRTTFIESGVVPFFDDTIPSSVFPTADPDPSLSGQVAQYRSDLAVSDLTDELLVHHFTCISQLVFVTGAVPPEHTGIWQALQYTAGGGSSGQGWVPSTDLVAYQASLAPGGPYVSQAIAQAQQYLAFPYLPGPTTLPFPALSVAGQFFFHRAPISITLAEYTSAPSTYGVDVTLVGGGPGVELPNAYTVQYFLSPSLIPFYTYNYTPVGLPPFHLHWTSLSPAPMNLAPGDIITVTATDAYATPTAPRVITLI
jgi:hypothetical protein